MPNRGAGPSLIIFDYIDRLALALGFTYLNNPKYSLTSLALAMLACLPSLFVNARVCGKSSSGAQPRNEPRELKLYFSPSAGVQKKKKEPTKETK